MSSGSSSSSSSSSAEPWLHKLFGDKEQATSVGELHALLEAGGINSEHMVWKKGVAPRPLHAIPELVAALKIEAPAPDGSGLVAVSEGDWLYADHTGAQQGPVSVDDLIDMGKKGAVHAGTLVWREELDNWCPIAAVPSLMATGSFAVPPTVASGTESVADPNAVWLYIDNYRVQRGPVSKEALQKMYAVAQVAANSLVWKEGQSEWKKLEDCEELKSITQQPPTHSNGTQHSSSSSSASSFSSSSSSSSSAVSSGSATTADSQAEKKAKKVLDPEAKKALKAEKRKRQKEKKANQWKEVERHSNIYFSGLPADATPEEVYDHFKKAGVIKKNPDDTPRIKLYRDEDGNLKGDGIVSYLNEESIQVAVDYFDQTEFRLGKKDTVLHVQKAEFKMKGEKYVPVKRAKVDYKKKIEEQKNELSWDDDHVVAVQKKGLRIVILKNMFTLEEAKQDPNFYNDLRAEVAMEVEKCGPIEKLTVFEGNPEGVIAIKYKTPAGAKACLEAMNGRFFGGRTLEAFYFDGKTNYKVVETVEQQQKRLEEFGDWIEKGGE